MTSPDLTAANIDKIAELFPGVDHRDLSTPRATRRRRSTSTCSVRNSRTTSSKDRRSATSSTGPASARPLFAANAPIAKTLRPVREESVDFDTTKNLFIEGDNLDALKLLQESYLGKVKLIYIDPPYNTGNDFVYDDDFAETSAEYLARSGQSRRRWRPPRREHRVERALPLRLAEHDVPTAEAGAQPAARRRGDLHLDR